jgi:hypothetical protein
MGYRLRDGLSWCVCAGRAVFLDLERDRYFCLRSPDDTAFRQLVSSPGHETDSSALARLERCGVLSLDAQATVPIPTATAVPVRRDLAIETDGEARAIDLARAIFAHRRAQRAVKRQPLAEIVAALSIRAADEASEAIAVSAELRRLSAAFASSTLFLRKQNNCLPRALAVRLLCRKAQIPAIVFGVRIEPFSAHCWAQWQDMVIVGDLEVVRLFTPILVVR